MSHQQQIGNLPDDYLDQMLSSLPCWNDFATPTEQHLAVHLDEDSESSAMIMHQISSNGIMSTPMPLPAATPICQNISGLERSIHGLYNGFAESQQFLPPPQGVQGSNGSAPRQRVRARRGQATDPHSIAERLRRERIAERMKRLQELVPNAYKTDKASMIDEIIDYVKFLQLQVKVLSVSRLGGPAAVAPLLTKAECGDAIGIASRVSGGDEDASLTMMEQQLAKLMEEDMGSAMQYLQGKGLCLMPNSFATAISTATSHSHSQPQYNNNNNNVNGMFLGNGNGSLSPTASVLTVQSSAFPNDATSALS